VAACASPGQALATLAELRAGGASVPLVLADQWMAGKSVFVVGGGNSAGQAALHLSKYARQVTVAVRSESLAASMSDYLIREIGNAPNIDVRFRTECAGGGGAGRLEHLELRDNGSGETRREPADGLFVLIGAEPFTGWLPEEVGRDEWGFILTGPDTEARWPLRRAQFMLEKACPGCSRWATSAAAP
jgi:thioredoxin reductase (NADPH)